MAEIKERLEHLYISFPKAWRYAWEHWTARKPHPPHGEERAEWSNSRNRCSRNLRKLHASLIRTSSHRVIAFSWSQMVTLIHDMRYQTREQDWKESSQVENCLVLGLSLCGIWQQSLNRHSPRVINGDRTKTSKGSFQKSWICPRMVRSPPQSR